MNEENRIRLLGDDNDDPKEEPLRISVAIDKGRVILAFGKTVGYVGFDPKSARMIAIELLKASEQV